MLTLWIEWRKTKRCKSREIVKAVIFPGWGAFDDKLYWTDEESRYSNGCQSGRYQAGINIRSRLNSVTSILWAFWASGPAPSDKLSIWSHGLLDGLAKWRIDISKSKCSTMFVYCWPNIPKVMKSLMTVLMFKWIWAWWSSSRQSGGVASELVRLKSDLLTHTSQGASRVEAVHPS